MILVLGVITLAAGLAMILAHNIWRGGALAVVVTLVGWLVLIKALLFLFLPLGAEAECILRGLRHPQLFYVCMIPSLVLGIYLTYCGFSSKFRSRRGAF
jgi:vacuolar-type H+-ATPase subunit I/STV1